MDDRAARPTGWLATLAAAVARWRAADPEPPKQWTPPRGLADLGPLLDLVRAAPAKLVGVMNPLARLPSGYEYRAVAAGDWAQAADIDPDVARVAWALASEAPPINDYPAYSWAIGEAILNAGVRLVTRDSRPMVDGHFGHQAGRWCASIQPPTWRHVKCAELVVARARAGAPNILAHGATQWTDEDTQHLVHVAALKAGDQGKADRNPPPEVVMRRRYANGAKWVGPIAEVTGEAVIDPWTLTLLGPAGATEEEAMAMLADGRRRWKRLV